MYKFLLKIIFLLLLILLIVFIILGGGFGQKNDNIQLNNGLPLIFAHRGLSNFAENSLESLIESKKNGFKAFEIDICFTKDNKLLVFHDKSCKRLLDINQDVTDLDFQKIKNEFIYLNGQKTKNKILTLEEVFSTFKQSQILYLDIKNSSKTLADSLLYLIRKHKVQKNVLIADSNILFLIYLKTKNPEIDVVLEGFNKGKEWIYYLIPKNFKPDYYSSFLSEVDAQHIHFLKDKNLLKRKIVYGINNENLKIANDLGIQNVIIDFDSSKDSYSNLANSFTKN